MKEQISQPTNSNLTEITKLLDSGVKEDFVRAVELALHQVLMSLHVEEHLKQLSQQVREEQWYQNLENTWEIFLMANQLNYLFETNIKWLKQNTGFVQELEYLGKNLVKPRGCCCL